MEQFVLIPETLWKKFQSEQAASEIKVPLTGHTLEKVPEHDLITVQNTLQADSDPPEPTSGNQLAPVAAAAAGSTKRPPTRRKRTRSKAKLSTIGTSSSSSSNDKKLRWIPFTVRNQKTR